MPEEAMTADALRSKVKFAVAEGTKMTFALALIAMGMEQINQGNLELGGLLLTIGWIALIINQFLVS